MKKQISILILLLTIAICSFGQATDSLVSTCALNAGPNAKYLKDFRIQLGKAAVQNDLRYKANMSLWKNTKYRFSLCNAENSKGQLILSIKDDSKKVVASSFDPKTGKTYAYVILECNKSGIYQLNYDFTDGQQGSGVCVVSMVK
jgi:hypothetical protein